MTVTINKWHKTTTAKTATTENMISLCFVTISLLCVLCSVGSIAKQLETVLPAIPLSDSFALLTSCCDREGGGGINKTVVFEPVKDSHYNQNYISYMVSS